MISTSRKWLALIIVLSSMGCSDSMQHLAKTSPSSPLERALVELLRDSTIVRPESLHSWCQVDDFYTLRNHRLLWYRDNKVSALADSMLAILSRVEYSGLRPEDYHYDEISMLAFRLHNSKVDVYSVAHLDLLLTDALFSVASHLRHGRVEPDSAGWHKRTIESDSVILNAITQGISRNRLSGALASLEPSSRTYKALKSALKERLDSLTSPDPTIDREALEREVADLSLSLEQWRWESNAPEGRYLLVNIPAYRLTLVNDDSVEFESRIIVGAPYFPTPILDGTITNFVTYPAWNVPRRIATRELLPQIRADSSYLAGHQYRILDVNGNEVHPDSIDWRPLGENYFPYLVQQVPGPYNALGLVKFNFVNPYNIYLHDTNARYLFATKYRALSHGCIRVERALELARHLVSVDNPWCSVNDFDRFMREELSKQVSVVPLPLRIRYITCEALTDGTVVCHRDVYGRNIRLAEAINCRNTPPTLAVNRVEDSSEADACL
ncbi:MAG TPA: L,D-transpeptidase family protein [Cyclobacteriaceae bacterium]